MKIPTSFGCPNCKTNNSQFHIVHPESQSAQIDPSTGEIIQNPSNNTEVDPFQYPYQGPQYQVQCPECGLIGEENTFILFGD